MKTQFRRAQKRVDALLRVGIALVVIVTPLALASPARAGTLAIPSWTVMDPRTSIPGNRYDWGLKTATAATLSRVTMSVPAGTTGQDRYLALGGGVSNWVSTPDSVANSPTTAIEMRMKLSVPSWSSLNGAPLFSKRNSSSSYTCRILPVSKLDCAYIRSNGSTVVSATSTTLPVVDGQPIWIRAVIQADNGAGSAVFSYFSSADGTNWSPVGSPAVYGSTADTIYDTSDDLELGSRSGGTVVMGKAKIYYADIRKSVTTATTSPTSCSAINVTICFNPNNDTIGGTSWKSSDATAETWTVNRTGTNLPADLASDLSVMNVTGLPAGGTAQNREIDGVTTYTLPTPTAIAATSSVSLGLAGFTNTYTPSSYTSAINTYDNAGTPSVVDSATTSGVTITSPAITTAAGMGNLLSPSTGITAISASTYPTGIAINGNTLYVGDAANDTINSVDLTSGLAKRFAGNGLTTFAGDGGPATSASFNDMQGVTVDQSGNVYATDTWIQRLRKINTSGNISTAAGMSSYNYSGDGGPATSASFRNIRDVAVNSVGDIWLADYNNCVIRKIDHTTNNISTSVGNGSCGYTGDGGSATSATLNGPAGVALDSAGNLYIADSNNCVIRRVDTSNAISTVVGSGVCGTAGDGGSATAAKLSYPIGLFIDGSNNLYIADPGSNRIRKVNSSNVISTFAGTGTSSFSGDGGQATAAAIWGPQYVKGDASGNIYFSDRNNFRVRKIDTSGVITTVMGNGTGPSGGDGSPATAASFVAPRGASADSFGNVYVAETTGHVIRKIDQYGTITKFAGAGINAPGLSGNGAAATSAQINGAQSIAASATGTVYIADTANNAIRSVISGNIATLATFTSPVIAVAVNPITGDIWSTESDCNLRKTTTGGNTTVVAGNGTCGTYSGDGGLASSSGLYAPTQLAFNSKGDCYFIDNMARVRKVDSVTGYISTVAGQTSTTTTNNQPALSANIGNGADALVIDQLGTIYVGSDVIVRAFIDGGPIWNVAGNGTAAYSGDGGPATSASFVGGGRVSATANHVGGLAISQGNLYITDRQANNVRKIANISPVAPLVNNDAMSTPMNATRSWPILSNDWSQGYEMDPNNVSITTQPTNGAVSLTVPSTESSTLQANYTPTTSYTGSDSFTYRACDTTRVLCATATVSVTVGSNQVTTVVGGVSEGYADTIAFLPARATRFRNYIFYSDDQQSLVRRYDIYSKQTVAVAGNGIQSTAVGMTATSSSITRPYGVAVAPDGTLYIADNAWGAVDTVSPSGILSALSGISNPSGVALGRDGTLYAASGSTVVRWNGTAWATFAGTGILGGSGNGGPATSARLNAPQALLGSSNGDLYISDASDCTVRKVSTTGVISAVVGTSGVCSYSGDGSSAISATLNSPRGMAFDSAGNLVIADFGNSKIRSVSTNGVISTVSTTLSLNSPLDIVAGTGSDFYVLDYYTRTLAYVPTSLVGTKVIGNSYYSAYSGENQSALSTQIAPGSSSTGLAVDSSGNLYIGEASSNTADSHRIRYYDATTKLTSTYITTANPSGFSFDPNGLLVFSEYDTCTVKRVNANKTITVIAGTTNSCGTSGNGGQATAALLNRPLGTVYDSAGNLYISEVSGNVIRKVDTTGRISIVGGNGSAGLSGDGGPALSASLSSPTFMSFDKNGNLLISDTANNRIRMIDRFGTISTFAGSGTGFGGDGGLATSALLNAPQGLVVDPANNVLVADGYNNRIRMINAASGIISTVAGGGTTQENSTYATASFGTPGPIALDALGNVYVEDIRGNKVTKVASVAYAGTNSLTNSTWNVVPGGVGHINLRECFTVTPSLSAASSKISFTLPSSVAGTSLSIVSQYGVSGTATATLSGSTLTISYPSQTLTAGVPLGFSVEGLTNGGPNGSYVSNIVEYDGSGTTAIGWSRSNIVNLTSAGAPTSGDAGFASIWQKSLSTTSSALATVVVSPSGTTDSTSAFTIATAGNLTGNGFAAAATAATASVGTLAPVTADQITSVSSALFPANRWGLMFVATSGSNAGATGAGFYSGVSTSQSNLIIGMNTSSTATLTARTKVNYLAPAGTYKATLTWRVTAGV